MWEIEVSLRDDPGRIVIAGRAAIGALETEIMLTDPGLLQDVVVGAAVAVADAMRSLATGSSLR